MLPLANKMTKFVFQDVNSHSYKLLLASGCVLMDGFQNDYFLTTMLPEYFGPNTALSEERRSYYLNRFGKVFGQIGFLDLLGGKAYICSAIEGERVVAACVVKYPANQQPKLTVWQRLKYWYYTVYIIGDIILNGSPHKQFLTPRVKKFFKDMYRLGGGIQTKDYYVLLSQLSSIQLKDSLYPMDKTLYIELLAVSEKCHGKGYGSALLQYSLSMFKERYQVFRSGKSESIGPAKASLYPTKDKKSFYEKYGFRVVSSATCDLTDKVSYKVEFMQLVL